MTRIMVIRVHTRNILLCVLCTNYIARTSLYVIWSHTKMIETFLNLSLSLSDRLRQKTVRSRLRSTRCRRRRQRLFGTKSSSLVSAVEKNRVRTITVGTDADNK